jgi:ABC-type amino acid transport system permease subunit
VDYLGSYGESSGEPPGAQECRLCLLQTVSRGFAWSGFAGVAAYWLACLVGAGLLIRRSAPGTIRRGFAVVAVMLIGVTLVQYLTAVLGEGNEITKHLSVALLAATLAPVWLAAGAFTREPTREKVLLQVDRLSA